MGDAEAAPLDGACGAVAKRCQLKFEFRFRTDIHTVTKPNNQPTPLQSRMSPKGTPKRMRESER